MRLAFEKIRGLQLELEDKIKVRGRALGFRLLCSSHISHLHLHLLQLRIACRACWYCRRLDTVGRKLSGQSA